MGRQKAQAAYWWKYGGAMCLVRDGSGMVNRLFNKVLEDERMPEGWRKSVLASIFKNKGDVQI